KSPVIDKLRRGDQCLDEFVAFVSIFAREKLADTYWRRERAGQVQAHAAKKLVVARQIGGFNMEFAQLGEDIVVDKIRPRDFRVCRSRCSDDPNYSASRLPGGPNQYRGLARLDSGNDPGTCDGCDLRIVDLI